jgi:eukaryotic-like serine/threonine-protein kinase
MNAGDVVSSKYRLGKRLGDGAMGEVWEALNQSTGRKVALKLISRPSPDHCHRLLREALMCGRLQHRNIVEIYDVAQTAAGDPFLVMQLLCGETLAERLRRRRRLRTPLATRIARDVASALAAAHDARIIHRDLKPANIFLHTEGSGAEDDFVVKVLDFGVGKDLASNSIQFTATGMAVGSCAYMSPEQIHAAKDLDHRSDLWTLGVVLFEMLTGERPFRQTQPHIFGEILSAPIPSIASPVRKIPPELDALIARCLERDRPRRYQDARELCLALAPFAEESTASADVPSISPQPSSILPGECARPRQDSLPALAPLAASAAAGWAAPPKSSSPSLPGLGAAPAFQSPTPATSTPLTSAPISSASPPCDPSSTPHVANSPRPLSPPANTARLAPGSLASVTRRHALTDPTRPLDGRAERGTSATPWDPEAQTTLRPAGRARLDDVSRTEILDPRAPVESWRKAAEQRHAPGCSANEIPQASAAPSPVQGVSGDKHANVAAPSRAIMASCAPATTATAPLERRASKTEPLPSTPMSVEAIIDAPTLLRPAPQRRTWGRRAGSGAALGVALLGLIVIWRLLPSRGPEVPPTDRTLSQVESTPAAAPVPAATVPAAIEPAAPSVTTSAAVPPKVTPRAPNPAARPLSSAPRPMAPSISRPPLSGSAPHVAPSGGKRLPVCGKENKSLKPPACVVQIITTFKPYAPKRP